MSKHSRRKPPPSSRPERRGVRNRSVILGIKPWKKDCSYLGVAISYDDDQGHHQQVVPPDEARWLARDESDAEIKRLLLQFADFLDGKTTAAGAPSFIHDPFLGANTAATPPSILHGEALRCWIIYHRDRWREAYREARRQGFSAEVVVIASPSGQRIDDPGLRNGWEFAEPAQALQAFSMTKEFSNPFAEPLPDADYFRAFATCGSGRFHGSIEVMLRLLDPDQDGPAGA